jgi:DNA mismatch repair ATPase MutS
MISDKALAVTGQELFYKFSQLYPLWKKAVQIIAEIDCSISLAKTSQHQNDGLSCRPEFIELADNNNHAMLELREAVHPVLCGSERSVETMTGQHREFIANDTVIGCAENPARFILVSGPNSMYIEYVCCY